MKKGKQTIHEVDNIFYKEALQNLFSNIEDTKLLKYIYTFATKLIEKHKVMTPDEVAG